MTTGQLTLSYLRYVVPGEIAGAWELFGGFGALLTNLAHLMELSIARNLEAASRLERAQSSARAHAAREGGNLQRVKDELIKINRDRLRQ